MIFYLIGLYHFISMVLWMFYLYIVKQKYWFDIVLILSKLILGIQWFFLKGECSLSYMYKKHYDNTYILGTNYKLSDIAAILPKYINVSLLVYIISCINLYVLYILLLRNNFSLISSIIIVISEFIIVTLVRTKYKQLILQFLYCHFFVCVYGLIMFSINYIKSYIQIN